MAGGLDVAAVRADFPLLSREVAGRPIVYFDNAATSLTPRPVIEAVTRYMTHSTANIHRAKHLLSQEASIAFEDARDKVARFLGCESRSVIFVRGTTEAINLVASGMRLAPEDNVVGTMLEHHSNVLPWKARCEYRAAPLDARGLPSIEAASKLVDEKTRLLAVTSCSNVTGVRVPLDPWRALAASRGVPLLVDAAQAALHAPIDLAGVDFLALSGHKMCAPGGSGVLYGKVERLDALDPVNLGGGTVSLVREDHSYQLRDLPWRLEAGTPAIASVIGLGAAVDYLEQVGRAAIAERDAELRRALDETFASLDGLESLEPSHDLLRAPIQSFRERTNTFPPDYLTRLLSDTYGIMARAGHHCAHPLHTTKGVDGTARVSLAFYNTEEELAYLADSLRALVAMATR